MRCINMGYIERDFPRERDPEAEARAEFNRNAALSRESYRAQPRRVERRRAELARNPKPPVGADFQFLACLKIFIRNGVMQRFSNYSYLGQAIFPL
jgi:hypothetical protein